MANAMELEINGSVYRFKAGFAFIREVEPLKTQVQNGVRQDVGLNFVLAGIYDGDVESLRIALDKMNKGENPRITKAQLEEYIEECDDIEKLFKDTIDFLSNANCLKLKAKKFAKAVADLESKNGEA